MVNGRSALHLAVINNHPEIVKMLLKAGAYVEHRDHVRGQTPLSEAAEYGLAHVIRILLEAREGASATDVETRSSAGLTPLHWACRFNSPDSVDALLSAGADPDAVDFAAAAVIASSVDNSTATDSTLTEVEGPCPSTAPYSAKLGCHLLDVAAIPCDRKLPTAADVIGLGDPCKWKESPNREFLGELPVASSRRRDPVSAGRIRMLLHRARKEKAWRRRGWLVILVNRLETRGTVVRAEGGGSMHVYGHAGEASYGDTIDVETEKGLEGEVAMWGVKGLMSTMYRGGGDEGTKQMAWGADVGDGGELGEDDDDDSITRADCGLSHESRKQADVRSGRSFSGLSSWGVYAGPGTKRLREDLRCSFDARSDNGGSMKHSCTAAAVEEGRAYAENTPCIIRNSGGRYGNIDADDVDLLEKRDGGRYEADHDKYGDPLDDNNGVSVAGLEVIPRLVGLACVEMGIFRRIVCFI